MILRITALQSKIQTDVGLWILGEKEFLSSSITECMADVPVTKNRLTRHKHAHLSTVHVIDTCYSDLERNLQDEDLNFLSGLESIETVFH